MLQKRFIFNFLNGKLEFGFAFVFVFSLKIYGSVQCRVIKIAEDLMVSIKTLIGGKQEDKTFAIRKFYFEKRN